MKALSSWVWCCVCLNPRLQRKVVSNPKCCAESCEMTYPLGIHLLKNCCTILHFSGKTLLKMLCVLLNHYCWQRCTRKEDLSVSSQTQSRVCMESCTIFINPTRLIWESLSNSKHRTISCHIFSKQSHTL